MFIDITECNILTCESDATHDDIESSDVFHISLANEKIVVIQSAKKQESSHTGSDTKLHKLIFNQNSHIGLN